MVAPVPRRPRINIINNGYKPGEITSTSFYANPPTDDSRPTTATSNASTETVQSAYGLRTTRKRTYKEPADDAAWTEEGPPPKKRRAGAGSTAVTAPANRGGPRKTGNTPVDIAPAPQAGTSGSGHVVIAPAVQGNPKARTFKSYTRDQ